MADDASYSAVDLYRAFHGEDPEYIDTVDVQQPEAVALIGQLDEVWYTTVREGKTERYRHKFKVSRRPLLCVSSDGAQLVILGGEYLFTDRGIEG